MERALGSEEEGKKRKQQGQDRWAEREHLEKKISPRVNRTTGLRENIWRRKSAQE
jgi:hypothetical protein